MNKLSVLLANGMSFQTMVREEELDDCYREETINDKETLFCFPKNEPAKIKVRSSLLAMMILDTGAGIAIPELKFPGNARGVR